MDQNERLGIVASIAQLLQDAGSWTGRTHIQKLAYMAQELLNVPWEYEFILYQRGPYSFALDWDIRYLRSIGALDIRSSPPYGPTYFPTASGEKIAASVSIEEPTKAKLRKLTEVLATRHARELELLATALWVERTSDGSDEDIIERVTFLKPHFRREEVESGLKEVRELDKNTA